MMGSNSYAYSSAVLEHGQLDLVNLPSESSKNTRIADEKRARKAVEEDAARLQNRVQTLQKEEQKAQKRLNETRLKAQDLLALRARNEQRQTEREQRYQQQQVGTQLHAQCLLTTLKTQKCKCDAIPCFHCNRMSWLHKGKILGLPRRRVSRRRSR